MGINLNSGYGMAQAAGLPYTTGKVFVVASSSESNWANIDSLYGYDNDGVQRRHSDFNSAVSTCVSGRGDVIILAPDYTASISSSDVVSAEDKGVAVYQAGKNIHGNQFEFRSADTLAQSGNKTLFNVTGKIKLNSIIGEITTDIQAQTNNQKLIASPDSGSNTDLCTTLDINGHSAGGIYTITGTLSDALQFLANGAIQYTSNPLLIDKGDILLSNSASSTGEIKWKVEYEPITPGARVVAA